MTTAALPDKTHRLLEVVAVILLGIATVGSAWCGFEASQWNGEESKLGRQASDQKVEASRLFGLATQAISYDSNMVAQYAQAVQSGDTRLQQFIRGTLMRPAFLPILDEWQAQAQAGGQPANLLIDQKYLDAQLAAYNAAEAESEATAELSQVAGKNADDYVLVTLGLAVALFFAGVAGSFKFRAVRVLLLVGAAIAIGIVASRLVDLPVV